MWFFLKIIKLAALYLVASYGAWALAIPPYYVSVFWPAAGIALGFTYLYGARVLPGVFLGAFASVLLSPIGHDFDFAGTLFAIGIAGGATLQAFIGDLLIKKAVGPKTQFHTLRSISLFSAIGVVSSFVACTLAVVVFLLAGKIDVSGVVGLWESWFIGDALGVLLVAPLIVLAFGRRDISFRRRLAIIVPVVLLFVAVVSLFFNIKAQYYEARQERFHANVELVKREMQAKFDSYYSYIKALKSFYDASSFVDREEFTTFVDYMLTDVSGVHAIAWAPYVAREDTALFLEEARKLHGEDFRIRDISGADPAKVLEPDFTMPVLYIAPIGKSDDAVGADLWSNALRREAFKRARDQNVVAATEPVSLVDIGEVGFIAAAPIYDKDAGNFKGAVIAAFQYKVAVNEIIDIWRDRGVELILSAQSDGKMRDVYSSHEGIHETAMIDGFVIDAPYVFGGQEWLFQYYMNPVFYNQNLNFTIWYALIAGLIFVSFTSVFLISITGQSAVMKDLVDEKTAELSHKNKFLKIIMDTVPDMIFVKDKDFKIVQANQAFFEKFPPEERDQIIGTTGLEQFPQEEQDIYLKHDKIALDKGVSESRETNTDYKGDVRILQTRKERFIDENDEAFLLGYAQDITDLLSTQSKLETILDTTADGLMTIKEDGVIETYNKACELIFGYDSVEAIGQNVSNLIPDYDPKDHSISDADSVNRQELNAKRKDGVTILIDISIAEVTLGTRKIYSGVVRDITERNKVTEELKRSNKELESFAYVTSHDLKAPLRHVSMSASFFKEEYAESLDAKSKELLNIMIDGTKRMQNMIESLLSYSRVGRDGMEMEEVNLNEVLTGVKQNLSAELSANAAIISVKTLPKVMADRYLMIQLFQNLIQNSLKYKKDGVSPRITISCVEKPGFYELSFADNGIGIDASYAEKIFQIFQRLHRDHEYEGVGIGLAICQRIVEFHGGRIGLDTDYKSGAKIDFTLPKPKH